MQKVVEARMNEFTDRQLHRLTLFGRMRKTCGVTSSIRTLARSSCCLPCYAVWSVRGADPRGGEKRMTLQAMPMLSWIPFCAQPLNTPSTTPLNTPSAPGSTKTRRNLEDYIALFSDNARAIFEEFEFGNTVIRLEKAGLLYKICQNFAKIDLHRTWCRIG
uniref:Uncharacterized protein n=1 Tax=Klebsiella pneumoniae TaxID=573 RepID=A0A2P1BPG5_KLEPN|nr:hypothetical protein [Klebsiella pneumoniae]